MTNFNLRTLRRVALFGLAGVVSIELLSTGPSRGGLGLGLAMLLVASLAVVVVSLVLMPAAAGTLFGNKDLLVPLALVTVASKLLGWLAAAPGFSALLAPTFPLHLLSLSFGVSLSFLLQIALGVAYATWVTGAVVELVRHGNSDPCRVLPLLPGRYWRILGVEFLGWGVMMAATSVLLLLMPVLMFIALALLLGFAVAWNFATAAVLPVAWTEEGRLWPSFRTGMAASRARLGQWWPLLLAQLLLLGMIFLNYSSSGGHTNFSWSINAFWTGGYEDDCRWYDKLAEACHRPKLPVVETLLSLLFGAFAVAIKVAIVQRLPPEENRGQLVPQDSNAAPADTLFGPNSTEKAI